MPDITSKLTNPESAAILSYLYDKHHNLQTKDKISEVIFGDIMMREEESRLDATRLENRMDLFLYFDVHRCFGISFTEFLSLPTDVCDMMLDKAEKIKTARDKALPDLDEELGAIGKG